MNPYILFVGRFAEYKGVDWAIEAFSRISQKSGVRLRLMGDEEDQDSARVKDMVRKLDARDIDVLPFQRNKSELLQQMQQSLFTLVPSRFYENLPNTILESFACGRPVIATNLGSISEIVQDKVNGLLFSYGDMDDFARKMEWLIAHAEPRERMGEAAFSLIQTEYSRERHLEKLMKVFEHVKGVVPELEAVAG